jgi:hypothetical protein
MVTSAKIIKGRLNGSGVINCDDGIRAYHGEDATVTLDNGIMTIEDDHTQLSATLDLQLSNGFGYLVYDMYDRPGNESRKAVSFTVEKLPDNMYRVDCPNYLPFWCLIQIK